MPGFFILNRGPEKNRPFLFYVLGLLPLEIFDKNYYDM